MPYELQLWIVVGCVLLAAWRVALRIRRSLKPAVSDSDCGGCHGCAQGSNKLTPPLVQLDLFQKAP